VIRRGRDDRVNVLHLEDLARVLDAHGLEALLPGRGHGLVHVVLVSVADRDQPDVQCLDIKVLVFANVRSQVAAALAAHAHDGHADLVVGPEHVARRRADRERPGGNRRPGQELPACDPHTQSLL
jgi:creatinine amidohydrolase/Fe(II)-dependent formamide hydrolase-like protein